MILNIAEKCSRCGRNCCCNESKNFDFVAEIAGKKSQLWGRNRSIRPSFRTLLETILRIFLLSGNKLYVGREGFMRKIVLACLFHSVFAMDLIMFIIILMVLLLWIEYLQIGNLLLDQRREKRAIYKNLSARFRLFRRKPQLFLPNWHYTKFVLTYVWN